MELLDRQNGKKFVRDKIFHPFGCLSSLPTGTKAGVGVSTRE